MSIECGCCTAIVTSLDVTVRANVLFLNEIGKQHPVLSSLFLNNKDKSISRDIAAISYFWFVEFDGKHSHIPAPSQPW
jgi:hypothetical protein